MITVEENKLGKVFFDAAYANLEGLTAWIRTNEIGIIFSWIFIVLLSVALPITITYIIIQEARGK